MSTGSAGPPAPWRPARPPIRWGLPDAALAWFAGLVLALVAGVVVAGVRNLPSDKVGDDIGVLIASAAGTYAGIIGALAVIARIKGRGSLSRDFGLAVRPRDGSWLLAGVVLQLLTTAVLLRPLVEVYGRTERQDVVKRFEAARGWQLAVFAALVVVVAPLAEELLFRGLLLRALMRRTTAAWAIFGSALVFALVHPLTDPTIGSVIAVPGLLVLGLASGALAVRTGDLSASILLHAGFNLLTAILIIASR